MSEFRGGCGRSTRRGLAQRCRRKARTGSNYPSVLPPADWTTPSASARASLRHDREIGRRSSWIAAHPTRWYWHEAIVFVTSNSKWAVNNIQTHIGIWGLSVPRTARQGSRREGSCRCIRTFAECVFPTHTSLLHTGPTQCQHRSRVRTECPPEQPDLARSGDSWGGLTIISTTYISEFHLKQI